MIPAQLVLTDDPAVKALLAINTVLGDPNIEMTEEERVDYKRLAVFLGAASQPQSRRNKRKARQEKRQGYAKWRRRERKALVAQFNAAREQYEAEAREAEAYWKEVEERLAGQPKYDVVSGDGQTVLSGIPAEMIVKEDGTPAFPKLIVVGGE